MSTSPMRSARCLAACEGALLVVDASQGVEAQTLANVYQAIDAGLEIVPVLNKIDLPAAEPERVRQQIEDVIGIDASEAIEISAKTGLNIEDVLEAVVHRLPAPKGDANAPLKALLVDSWYDAYLGVVVLVRIIDGALKKGQKIRMMAADARLSGRAGRRVHAQEDAGGTARPRRSRLHHRRRSSRWPTPRSATPSPTRRRARAEAAARLQAGAAGGVLRPVPGRCRPVRGSARCAVQAASERCELHLRDRNLGRAGLRLPLRVSGPAASGDRARAAGARIQSRSHHHRAQRDLSHPS